MELLGFMLLGLAVCFYFLPAVISSQRRTEHSGMIFLINLLFGWTILGWIAALIWAVVEKTKPPEPPMGPSINGVPVRQGRLWGEPLPPVTGSPEEEQKPIAKPLKTGRF